MRAAILMGLVGGQRAMTPLAAICLAASRGWLPADNPALRLMAAPAVARGALALALAELAADKWPASPDRIIPIGLAARFATAALAGAALTTRRQRWQGAALGGTTAVIAAFAGWRVRQAAMRITSQTRSGLAEDALVVMGALAAVRMARVRPARQLRTGGGHFARHP